MNRVSLVSDQYIENDFIKVLGKVVKANNLPFKGVTIGASKHSKNVLIMGNPNRDPDIVGVQGPTVKQVMRTASGATKLKWALIALAGMAPKIPPKNVILLDTVEKFMALDIEGKDLVVDIETSGKPDVDEDTDLLCIGLGTLDNDDVYVVPDSVLYTSLSNAKLLALLRNNRTIAHNAKFDFKWLSRYTGFTIYGHNDTMLMHYLLFPAATGDHGLKIACKRILNVDDWETDLKLYVKGKHGFENIPRDILYEYNACDIHYTRYLYKQLYELLRIEPAKLRFYYDVMMEASRLMQDIEPNGFQVDLEYTNSLFGTFGAEFDRLKAELGYMVGDEKFNPNSWQQVLKALKSVGLNPANTNEKTLNMYLTRESTRGEARDFIAKLLEFRKVNKNFGTYVKGVLNRQRGGRVYPSYKLHGTTTGRLSSADPNIQNIPRDKTIRRQFISAPGTVLIGCDYSQAELRTMAELSNDEVMIADFQRGSQDFFDALMPNAYPYLEPEEYSREAKGYKDLRAKIKGVVYGMSYGRKAKAIAQALEIPVSEAQGIIDGYLSRYPKLAAWRAGIMDHVRAGTLVTPWGRSFQSDVITSATRTTVENAALAFQPQSTASDICLSAAIKLNHLYHNEKNIKIVALVHDNITTEAPPSIAEDVMSVMQRVMEEAALQVFNRVPFLTEGAISTRWDET